MFGVLFKKLLQSHLVPQRGFTITAINPKPHLGFGQDSLLLSVRLLSSARNEIKERSFTVSYLINSCGLSPKSAESASRRVNFESPKNPDAVIRLLKGYGFTNTIVSKIITRSPGLLLTKPEENLVPKLEFLKSIGASNLDLASIVSANPSFLQRSLERTIVPSCNILKNVVHSDANVLKSLRHTYGFHMLQFLDTNISVLRGLGMPSSMVTSIVTKYPDTVSVNSDKFSEAVGKVVEIGFDPSKHAFVHALLLFVRVNQKTLEDKMVVYMKYGLSKDDTWSAFGRFPWCLAFSEKKIMDTLDFLVNKMGFLPVAIARNPSIVCYSLRKRIIPRCSVIKVLMLKGLVKKEIALGTILIHDDKRFLDSFVFKFQDKVPELLSVFRGEVSMRS